MSRLSRSLTLAAVSLAALAAAQGGAQAGGFAIREQSATAQGYSFAGAASGSGYLSSMFWNPAVITMMPGIQSESHLSVIIPRVEIDPMTETAPFLLPLGGSGDIGQDAIVPTGYASYQINDMLWVGVSNTAPYGLVTDPRQNWAGQVYSRSSRIFSVNVNPVLGVKINDWFSVAAGPSLQYFDIRLKNAAGAIPVAPGAPSAILEGDDIGFGFTAGVTITPFAGTSIGIGYRSAIEHELEGSLSAPAGTLFGGTRLPANLRLPITSKLRTPDQVTIGLSQAISPALTVHAGFEWTNWSVLKEPAIVGPAGPVRNLELNYDDGYFYSLGMDYRLNNQWILRAGVAYEQSPIDTEIRSTRLPDNDRIWASVGVGYQWNEKLSLDVSYTHIFNKETDIRITEGHQDYIGTPVPLPFVADVDASTDIVSVALRYRWDDPKVAIPAAPIVTKY
jgi:long-chain fatty acid transport protein